MNVKWPYSDLLSLQLSEERKFGVFFSFSSEKFWKSQDNLQHFNHLNCNKINPGQGWRHSGVQFQAVVWRVRCCSFCAESVFYFYWRKYFLVCAMDKMSLRFISSMKGCAAAAILVLKQQDEICRPWSKRQGIRPYERRIRVPLRGSELAPCCWYFPETKWPLLEMDLAFANNLWYEVHSLGSGCRLKQQEQVLLPCLMLPKKWQVMPVP